MGGGAPGEAWGRNGELGRPGASQLRGAVTVHAARASLLYAGLRRPRASCAIGSRRPRRHAGGLTAASGWMMTEREHCAAAAAATAGATALARQRRHGSGSGSSTWLQLWSGVLSHRPRMHTGVHAALRAPRRSSRSLPGSGYAVGVTKKAGAPQQRAVVAAPAQLVSCMTGVTERAPWRQPRSSCRPSTRTRVRLR